MPRPNVVKSFRPVTLAETAGYHFIDLPGGETFPGQWDLRGRMPEYIGGVDVAGKRVLDIGCASGFLSFEMERLGAAEVVSFDADDHRRISFIPIPGTSYVASPWQWARDTDHFLERLKAGYWYCHQKLNSKATALYGDIYDIAVEDRSFDVVVVGQVLVHLRDPITALSEAARASRDLLVITEGVYDSPDPAGVLHARASAGGPQYIWWLLSVPAYRNILEMFGFQIETIHTASYGCTGHEYGDGQFEITSIVARRVRF